MMKRLFPVVLGAAMVLPMIGCDKEVAHDKTETVKANGDTKTNETTVKEKSDGTMVKEHTEAVDKK